MKTKALFIATRFNDAIASQSVLLPRALISSGRKGVLLLVVLSMLTLFLMLGAAYLVAATRARETARAYARLTLGSDEARIPYTQALDSVIFRVLRGPAISGVIGTGTVSFESLLADKYGDVFATGSVFGLSGLTTSGTPCPILTGTLQLSKAIQPTDLCGRVLTFAAPGRGATSHRIIRAVEPDPNANQTNLARLNFRIALDTPRTMTPFQAPIPSRVIINGREFTADGGPATLTESWDGFDTNNPFLARVDPATISTSTVSRMSYLPGVSTAILSGTWDYDSDGIPDAADNDNDGVWDGVFLNFGIPDTTDGNGNVVTLRASVLIVDLDGRFNVNAHDSLSRLVYAGTNMWPSVTGTSIPMGSGYGPAEVNGEKMFSTATSLSENPGLLAMAGGALVRLTGTRAVGSRYAQAANTPRVDFVEGRYGRDFPTPAWPPTWPLATGTTLAGSGYSRPGISGTNDTISQITDRRADDSQLLETNYGVPTVWWTGGTASFNWADNPGMSGIQPLPRGVFNSPPDLHGRMRTTTIAASGSAIVPQLVYGKPEWSNSMGSFETTDDPYDIVLDSRTSGGSWLHDPATSGIASGTASYADNPFLLSELEPVLRPYDLDANSLSMRLTAILGSAAEDSRLKLTTDSWDTTAITGSAAAKISSWLQATTGTIFSGTSPVRGIIGGEVSRGERFDLNRALLASSVNTAGYNPNASGTSYNRQRQAYFKDLYTLLVMISSTGGNDPTALTPGGGVVSGTAATPILAQYAANVLEFRDADSIMTPLEYDTNPSNGWDVDGDVCTTDGGSNERRVVFGAERPEILIQQAFAWRDSVTGSAGMAISLHRPWNAKGLAAVPTPATIDAEPCDYALDTLVSPSNTALITGSSGVPNNLVDLGKKPHSEIMRAGTNSLFHSVASTSYPIWRLRIVTGSVAQYVRFDTNAPGSNEFAPTINSGTDKPRIAPDSTITFFSGTTITLSGSDPATAITSSTTAFLNITGVQIPGMRASGTNSPVTTVSLERLSDPTQTLTATGTVVGTAVTGSAVWLTGTVDARLGLETTTVPLRYIVVDSCTVPVIETSRPLSTPPPLVSVTIPIRSTTSATAAFWATAKSGTNVTLTAGGTITFPRALTSGSTAWFPWANRPFVSSAELLLVSRYDSLGLLENYTRPTPTNQFAVGIPVALDLLFDAVHVPTRFAGVHRSYTLDHSAATGIFNETHPANQLSSFREPGRVNLNTVVSDDVWNAVVSGPLASPAQLRSGSTPPVPASPSVAANFVGSGTNASMPTGNLFSLLTLNIVPASVVSDSTTVISGTRVAQNTSTLAYDRNPLHEFYTATRLANTVTPRSNVFAVWVTLREATANDPDSVKYRRAFYIVDRSIPVGYEEGKDHNVRDCIRLRRVIE